MSGKIIGYVRVSTFDQNPERQLEGIPVDRLFTDQASGKDLKRPAFEELMAYVREGDQVIIHSMDRLARNLDHLRQVVNRLNTQGISVRFLKENLTFTGQDSPMANLMLSVMGAMAEFERSLIRERQREGVQIAKAKGLYTGRKKSLSQEQLSELQKRIAEGEKKASLARHFNISRETLYQYVKLSPTLAMV
ncbi:MAG: recombinase family protein [Alphaproteobacteria bacterium]|nr:recombinase family protein [Alphaproteobacteria bacterium]